MNISPKLIAVGIAGVIGLVGLSALSSSLFYNNDASHILVKQSFNGTMSCDFDAGSMKWLWFGSVTRYQRQDQFSFSALKDQGSVEDQSLPTRFNDGADSTVSGTVLWEMPTDCPTVLKLHAKFPTQRDIDQKLIRTVMQKSVFTAGPFMSSTESYAARRNEFLQRVEEQIVDGVYVTETVTEMQKDPISGQMQAVAVIKLKKDEKGNLIHAADSPLKDYNITISNLSINHIGYPDRIEAQIKQQQEAVAQVQIQQAQAKQAEQRAITAAKEGEADAAKAKWEKEVIKIQAVTGAQQAAETQKIDADRDATVAKIQADKEATVAKIGAERDLQVAQLGVQTAEQNKEAAILRGEGEAKARQLILAADGALKIKGDLWLESQKAWAQAFSSYKGNLVPQVVQGGNGSGTVSAGDSAQNLLSLMGVKAARDLALDLSIPSGAAPAAK
jgi:regulator of protease activity HflC (stomatin/prohibitin superfamily)